MPDKTTVDHSTTVKVADTVLRRSAGEETVLLDLGSEKFYGLDGVGARALELLEEPRRIDDLVDALAAEYDVDRGTLMHDVLTLVVDLVEHDLLVTA